MVKYISTIDYTDFYKITSPVANSKSYLVSIKREYDDDGDIHYYAHIWLNDEWKPFIEMCNCNSEEIINQIEILIYELN